MVSRKIFTTIFSSLLLISIFSSCDPEEALNPTNRVSAYITNNTGENLIIKSTFSVANHEAYYSQEDGYNTLRIASDSTFYIRGADIEKDFPGNFFDEIFVAKVIYDTIWIYSRDSVLLNMWTESHKNDTGKQFFREDCWGYKYYEKNEGKTYKYHDYTFTINPENLNPKFNL